jgi:hypothetical protein
LVTSSLSGFLSEEETSLLTYFITIERRAGFKARKLFSDKDNRV